MSESRGISGRGLGLGFAPNLRYVAIVNCENLKTPLSGWGLNWLSSLKVLIIAPGGYQNVISFSHDDDDCHLCFPTFLTRLNIGNFQNLESMASLPLPTLVSLQRLYIWDCLKLQLFLPKEGLPATLGWLQIMRCPIIKKRCLKGRGQDLPYSPHSLYANMRLLMQFKPSLYFLCAKLMRVDIIQPGTPHSQHSKHKILLFSNSYL